MFGIDSKFYEVVSKIADLVVVNLLFVLCSLPIITIGASTTALYGVTKKMAENREGYIFRNYFRLFKENFKQSTIMWIILLLLALIPTIDLYIINSSYKIIYVFLTIFLYLLKCPQSLILSALRAFCFCGKPHISRSIFLYFRYQAWLKSW